MTTHEYSKHNTPAASPRGRLARALVFLLTQALVLQPAAFAAPNIWDVAQQPLFTVNPVHPNIVFMIDDSWSMNDYRLPPPPFMLENNRWPAAAATVKVIYGQGMRTVAAHDEFTLRSSVHNPLAYDPAVTYVPWNDNDKPLGVQGTRPRRDENFPQADIGGVGAIATAGRYTERDMRHVGFANGNSNAIRKWITESRGTVGSNGTYLAASPARRPLDLERAEQALGTARGGSEGNGDLSPAPGRHRAGGRSLHKSAVGLQRAAALYGLGAHHGRPMHRLAKEEDRHHRCLYRVQDRGRLW